MYSLLETKCIEIEAYAVFVQGEKSRHHTNKNEKLMCS
jgi:hypothetical protein